MIGQKNRFHGHRAVSKVKGRVEHSKSMSIRSAKNNKGDFRLAVVVSKKVAPHAVERNRIRRRIFEQVRIQKRFNNLPVDAVIYVKTAYMSTESAENVALEITELSKKALARLS